VCRLCPKAAGVAWGWARGPRPLGCSVRHEPQLLPPWSRSCCFPGLERPILLPLLLLMDAVVRLLLLLRLLLVPVMNRLSLRALANNWL
jgi:hypothetical protein